MNKKLLFLCAALSLPTYSLKHNTNTMDKINNSSNTKGILELIVERDAYTEIFFDSGIMSLLDTLGDTVTVQQISDAIKQAGYPLELTVQTVNGASVVKLTYKSTENHYFGRVQCADPEVVALLKKQLDGKTLTKETLISALESVRTHALKHSTGALKYLDIVNVDYEITPNKKTGKFDLTVQIVRETDYMKIGMLATSGLALILGTRQMVRHNSFLKAYHAIPTPENRALASARYDGKIDNATLRDKLDAITNESNRKQVYELYSLKSVIAKINPPVVVVEPSKKDQKAQESKDTAEFLAQAAEATKGKDYYTVEVKTIPNDTLLPEQKNTLAELMKYVSNSDFLKNVTRNGDDFIHTDKTGKVVNVSVLLNAILIESYVGQGREEAQHIINFIMNGVLPKISDVTTFFKANRETFKFLSKGHKETFADYEIDALRQASEINKRAIEMIKMLKNAVKSVQDTDGKTVFGEFCIPYVFAQEMTDTNEPKSLKREGGVKEVQKLYSALLKTIASSDFFNNTLAQLEKNIKLLSDRLNQITQAYIDAVDAAISKELKEKINVKITPQRTFDDDVNAANAELDHRNAALKAIAESNRTLLIAANEEVPGGKDRLLELAAREKTIDTMTQIKKNQIRVKYAQAHQKYLDADIRAKTDACESKALKGKDMTAKLQAVTDLYQAITDLENLDVKNVIEAIIPIDAGSVGTQLDKIHAESIAAMKGFTSKPVFKESVHRALNNIISHTQTLSSDDIDQILDAVHTTSAYLPVLENVNVAIFVKDQSNKSIIDAYNTWVKIVKKSYIDFIKVNRTHALDENGVEFLKQIIAVMVTSKSDPAGLITAITDCAQNCRPNEDDVAAITDAHTALINAITPIPAADPEVEVQAEQGTGAVEGA